MRKSGIEMSLQNKPKHLWLKQQFGGEQVSPHGLSLQTGKHSLWQTACHLNWSSLDILRFKHWIWGRKCLFMYVGTKAVRRCMHTHSLTKGVREGSESHQEHLTPPGSLPVLWFMPMLPEVLDSLFPGDCPEHHSWAGESMAQPPVMCVPHQQTRSGIACHPTRVFCVWVPGAGTLVPAITLLTSCYRPCW